MGFTDPERFYNLFMMMHHLNFLPKCWDYNLNCSAIILQAIMQSSTYLNWANKWNMLYYGDRNMKFMQWALASFVTFM